MRFFLLLFIAVPVIELWVLITVGRHIGALATVGLVFATAIVGVALLRYQGLRTLFRGQSRLARGELPAQEVVEGMLLAFCGALLLTPGFVTDAIGFAGLLPLVRHRVALAVLRRGSWVVGASGFRFGAGGFRPDGRPGSDDGSIDGEFWREDDRKPLDRDRRP